MRVSADAVAHGIAAARCNDGADLLRDQALAGVTLARDGRGGLVKGLPYRLDGRGVAIERPSGQPRHAVSPVPGDDPVVERETQLGDGGGRADVA